MSSRRFVSSLCKVKTVVSAPLKKKQQRSEWRAVAEAGIMRAVAAERMLASILRLHQRARKMRLRRARVAKQTKRLEHDALCSLVDDSNRSTT
jgi:hypothetical protein